MKANKMVRLSFLVVLGVSLLAGCASSGSNRTDSAQTADQGLIRLHDIWVLETLEGQALELQSEAQRPRLEINSRDMSVFGFDGCNSLRGSILRADAEEIEFGPLASTRKACLNMELPHRFQQSLNQVRSYQRQGLKLYLFDEQGNELLSFQKTD